MRGIGSCVSRCRQPWLIGSLNRELPQIRNVVCNALIRLLISNKQNPDSQDPRHIRTGCIPLTACSTVQRDAIGRRSRPSRHGSIPQRPRLHRVEIASAEVPAGAESARGISPRAAHRSGLDTLASSGSCHRTKAAASRRELELLLLPVDSLPTSVTCPLRSTGITPLPRYYGAVRPYPPHRYFQPRSFPACTFSLSIAGQVLKFRTRARTRVMPPIHRAPRGQ